MRGLFSFLFGASMLLVIERAEATGRIAGRESIIARMLWLLVFGLLHFYFIWFGDILAALRAGRDDRLLLPQRWSRAALIVWGGLLRPRPVRCCSPAGGRASICCSTRPRRPGAERRAIVEQWHDDAARASRSRRAAAARREAGAAIRGPGPASSRHRLIEQAARARSSLVHLRLGDARPTCCSAWRR